ncbi:hypothetical protein GGR57DRAFT_462859 [Xylariaceae sp. FL1272]|nr:hypothetical protein GGR57DRAFT_462859 [Xylariaceae sp. FL1272]
MKFTLPFFLLGLCAAVPLNQARQADVSFITIPDRLALRHATGTAGHSTVSPPTPTGDPVPPSESGGSRPPYPTDGPTHSRGGAPPIPHPTGHGHDGPGSLPYWQGP